MTKYKPTIYLPLISIGLFLIFSLLFFLRKEFGIEADLDESGYIFWIGGLSVMLSFLFSFVSFVFCFFILVKNSDNLKERKLAIIGLILSLLIVGFFLFIFYKNSNSKIGAIKKVGILKKGFELL